MVLKLHLKPPKQSVRKPRRPPPAAEATQKSSLLIRGYCFGAEKAEAKSGKHLTVQ